MRRLALAAALVIPAAAAADGWDLLSSIEVVEVEEGEIWRAEKSFPDELRAAADGFRVTGYLVPIVPEPYLQTFLVVEDPADCPFCGSGGYGSVLEVVLREPMPQLAEFALIEVTGRLELIDDPMTLQSARLVDATAAPH